MSVLERIRAAETGDEVLAVLAKTTHLMANGADEPEIPLQADLADWWDECPGVAREKADSRLAALADVLRPGHDPTEESIWRFKRVRADASPSLIGRMRPAVNAIVAVLPIEMFAVLWGQAWYYADPPDGSMNSIPSTCGIWELTQYWLKAQDAGPDAELRHPFSPLVAEWQARPCIVKAGTRADPLLPVVQVRENPERLAGRLVLGGLMPDEPPIQLPLIPAPEGPRVPILELADAAGVPTMARGRGAPLELRIVVFATVLTPHADRDATIRLALTVRDIRTLLFPHGWQRGRDWPRVRQALRRTGSYMIPLEGKWWFPVALRQDPGHGAALDDMILMDVSLPPGSAAGPPVDRATLGALGAESAPRFRAYIAAHSVAWDPGRTRVVVPNAGGRRAWSRDPGRYTVLTENDRRRLGFGPSRKRRTAIERDAPWEDLPGVVVVSRRAIEAATGRGGWLVLPQAAAAAVRNRMTYLTGDNDLPNRGQ